MAASFLCAYISEIMSSVSNHHDNNYDYYRFGPLAKEKSRIEWKKLAKDILRYKGYVNINDMSQNVFAAIKLIDPYLSRFEWLYSNLSDDESRENLVKLLAFRVLGHLRVKLPLNTTDYWVDLKKMEGLVDPSDSIAVNFLDWQLFLIDLQKIGVPVRLYFRTKGVYQTFVLEQYNCKGRQIAVGPGDYVIDAGACWGDTALYFSHRTGESGRVFSYEFLPENLEVLRRNIALNPMLSNNIEVIEKALWSESDTLLTFEPNGPGTSVNVNRTDNALLNVTTQTIDDLVIQNNLPKLDFIKMDIEGSELRALQGATQTLLRFKPKLAISVYHNLVDFFEIPEFLNTLGVGYRFYLRHYTIHAEETVLFAEVT